MGGLRIVSSAVGCFFDSELCALFLHRATQSLFPHSYPLGALETLTRTRTSADGDAMTSAICRYK